MAVRHLFTGGFGFGGSIGDMILRGYTSDDNTFPLTGVEILYPIEPEANSNELSFKTANKGWNQTQKSTDAWHHELNTMKFRVRSINMSAFVTFLRTNKGILITLNVPGISPFIRATASNSVYIDKVGKVSRSISKPKHYNISIKYLRET